MCQSAIRASHWNLLAFAEVWLPKSEVTMWFQIRWDVVCVCWKLTVKDDFLHQNSGKEAVALKIFWFFAGVSVELFGIPICVWPVMMNKWTSRDDRTVSILHNACWLKWYKRRSQTDNQAADEKKTRSIQLSRFKAVIWRKHQCFFANININIYLKLPVGFEKFSPKDTPKTKTVWRLKFGTLGGSITTTASCRAWRKSSKV